LQVVRVVRARGRRLAGRSSTDLVTRLDAGLSEEGAGGIRHEASGEIEEGVVGRDRLPVEDVEHVKLRGDRDRADVEVVAEREVEVVIRRRAAEGPALVEEELRRVEVVEETVAGQRHAAADVELRAGREAERSVPHRIEARLDRTVEL